MTAEFVVVLAAPVIPRLIGNSLGIDCKDLGEEIGIEPMTAGHGPAETQASLERLLRSRSSQSHRPAVSRFASLGLVMGTWCTSSFTGHGRARMG